MKNIEKLFNIINSNNGTLTSAQVTQAKIPRSYLSLMIQKGILVKVRRGFYMTPDNWEDEMYILSCSYPKGVFSHGTALYIHGMTDRTPMEYEMSFPQGYHFRKEENNLKVRYLTKEVYECGIQQKKSPCENYVKVYNIEHTLCDIFKANYDIQIINDSFKRYVKSNEFDMNKLMKYAQMIKVKNKISDYLRVLL